MADERNVFVGILAVILGLIVITFPLISVSTLNVLTGIGLIFVGIWLIVQCITIWEKNPAAGISDFILAIFAILFGIVFVGDIKLFEFFTFLALYIVGFFIFLVGLVTIFSGKGIKGKAVGIIGIIFGVIYIIIGTYMGNPFFLAAIIGAFLIIAGIMELLDMFGENKE
ncbi:MAG: DUF308 domain-containing protein [Methanobacterium sp.]|uniref:DUF308 domain-containing protein n=1 Tax=Methanobacterium sp. TaxID=2164 RepID=UPI003D65283E|nr:DUF308 domain-containing protein [Methanobacterium sp.]